MKQRERVRDYFAARAGQWIPLPDLMRDLRAAQLNARIKECREMYGMEIENRMERKDGAIHSWYRLVPRAGQQELFRGNAA